MRRDYKCLLQTIAFTLIGSCFFSGLLAIVGFLCNIVISPVHFPLAVILSFILAYKWMDLEDKDEERCSQAFNKNKISAFAAVMLVLIYSVAISIAVYFYDQSYDGMHYHLASITELVNGWNPIYAPLPDEWTNMIMNSFAGKGIWYCAAALVKMTGILNASKAYHTIMMVAALCLSLVTFFDNRDKKRKIFSVLISLAIVLNPLYFYQLSSNYADTYLYNLSICMVCVLFMVDRQPDRKFNRLSLAILVMCIALLCNIKFTGIFFAGALYAVFYLKWWYEERRWGTLVGKALPGLMGLGAGLLLGINPYITNPLNGRNIFHPMLGAGKIDLMGLNVPEAIREKGTIGKLLYTMFSNVEGELKLPLVVFPSSVSNVGADLRYESFGAFFSALVLFAVFVFIFCKKKSMLAKQYLYFSTSIIVIGIVFPESWWGRYFPFWWMLPLMACLILLQSEQWSIGQNVVSCVLTVAALNTMMLAVPNLVYADERSKALDAALKANANQSVILSLPPHLIHFEKSTNYLLGEKNITVVETVPYQIEVWDYHSEFFSFTRVEP